VPTQLAQDSAFPFKPGDQVQLELNMELRELRIRLLDKNCGPVIRFQVDTIQIGDKKKKSQASGR